MNQKNMRNIKLYASENHFEKARKSFEYAMRIYPQFGDIWIY